MKIKRFNQKKFENVMLHILGKCAASPNFGKTMLYKMLYFSDFDYYELHEKYLTGETYKKIKHGPAPSHFDKIAKRMTKEKRIKKIDFEYYGKPQIKYIPLVEPDYEKLTASELKVIDYVISRFSSLDARKISELSHFDIPYEVTDDNNPIDYELVFYRKSELSVRSYDIES